MLANLESGQQDFFSDENHFEQMYHIKSRWIKGNKNGKCFISIVIPTYKRANLLKEAIDSCLDQKDFTDFNIVITDNDPISGNETELLIDSYKSDKILYYKNEENMGPLANFNRCIEMATGEYAIMLNTDDLLADDYLKNISRLLTRYPRADIIFPNIDVEINGLIRRQKVYQSIMRIISKFINLSHMAIKLDINDFLIHCPAGSPSGIVYKRETFLKSPGFNPKWHPAGDTILYYNMGYKYITYMTHIKAGSYRFIDNITQESGMWTLFIQDRFYIYQYLAKRLNKKWIKRYYKGSTYYRLNTSLNKKFGRVLDRQAINELFETPPNLIDFAFFSFIMFIALNLWIYRVFVEVLRMNLRGEK